MQQGTPIGAYSSAVPPPGLKPYVSYPTGSYPPSSYPTVSYSYQHYHPLYSAPIPHSTRQLHPILTTPSDSSRASGSSEDDQPLPSPSRVLFRPVDFDNPSGDQAANCFPSASCESTGGITVFLTEKKLWEKFLAVGNEMIVTKPGRRLFPSAVINVRGLNPRTDYTISLRARPIDKYRYKFSDTKEWVPSNESEVLQNKQRQVFLHPNSPNSGEFWMKKPVCFKPMKITHNSNSQNGNILLYTMHKYQLEVEVVATGSMETPFKILIPETTFIAVTSYQNQELTQLKIEHNPFAKGFRDRDVSPPPPPPSSYNRPILPLWQAPHLPLPYPPLPSMQPPESHAGPETAEVTTSPPDFAPESCSPAQQMTSLYPQHPMLSYPLPYPCMPWVYGLPPPQDPIDSSYSSSIHSYSDDVEDED